MDEKFKKSCYDLKDFFDIELKKIEELEIKLDPQIIIEAIKLQKKYERKR